MLRTVNMPVYTGWLDEYGSVAALQASLQPLGCDGLELIWGEPDYAGELPKAMPLGYHLLFWPDWVDFWRGDEAALLRKFGKPEAWTRYYGGGDRRAMLRQYLDDLERAARLGARYVVLHVSDVSIEEGYSYRWLHTNDQVIDAACALIDELTAARRWPFPILLENQWWPGLTLLENRQTERLLESLGSADKGLLLDTGHLLNTNTKLRTEAEAVDYLHWVISQNGALAGQIRGVHLHKSLSGAYVETHTGAVPPLPEEYFTRYSENYSHVLQIDRHEPWTEPAIGGVIRRIGPEFLTNELAAGSRAGREQALGIQWNTLCREG